jgi:hypothetical protein
LGQLSTYLASWARTSAFSLREWICTLSSCIFSCFLILYSMSRRLQWFVKLRIVHSFLEREENPMTKTLYRFFLLFQPFFLEIDQYGCKYIHNFTLISDLKDKDNFRKVHRNIDNPENCFSKNIPSPDKKRFLGLTFLWCTKS